MENNLLHGDLADTPFASLLFRVWKEKKTGHLKVKKETVEKIIYFQKGNIAIGRGKFNEKDLFRAIAQKNLLDSSSLKKCKQFIEKNKTSHIKAIAELGHLSPSHLWNLIEDYSKSDLISLFDWPQAEYSFEPELHIEEYNILFLIPTLDFILQGIRQMKNYDIIHAHVPQEEEDIQIVSLDDLNPVHLEPPEKYLLQVIRSQKNMKNIYGASELGKKESQKIIYGFLCLGIVGLPQIKVRSQPAQESSQTDLNKSLDSFNAKCSYIFKYISKEIGPVALSVLEKCIEETLPYLSPHFKNIHLGIDGKIKSKSIQKNNFGVQDEEKKQYLLRDLNEILAAEILAVKKTLGNDHESKLVQNLEKVG